ncbi:2-amino-4-hydroxy-6-hydroxymethyldihydropteridinepyrophosphokinase [Zhongshania aliphaticivorans]|uniref:2-amino-4-hydroxy-6-hydroxymethyldihydropteridine pyrophosphokinase n=1 Tax=Zhongshania aliphaticivorans TaxID=1470434 RepID=A0A5S9QAF0_9GAMM|nr:2-amino-4-hydroxy-6-hydroxymethyldihydropteridine diphosphokinase [Zhongshania aliphaticivorans]CAA0114790.1 2-amino-4-hydroxy-6-hydroxymethyldihydropteridinepyrophosphokinase [Zhongshania aliphaticivorans]CAA0123025.1 2-amino-4-hydroxy-6-hydroxymethyldihydropteridinepyrophosphokinase [Zhongshania aliphaticivorans]
MTRSYIGLGSNLNTPRQQVLSAIKTIAATPGCHLIAQSRLYGSVAIGPGEQDDYVNAVIAIDTTLTASKLLNTLQAIEAQHQRQRTVRWAARTLDLDLLLYGQAIIQSPELTVPHPRMFERDFVLRPLFDIAPAELLSHHGLNGPEKQFSTHYSDNDKLWVLEPDDKAITS